MYLSSISKFLFPYFHPALYYFLISDVSVISLYPITSLLSSIDHLSGYIHLFEANGKLNAIIPLPVSLEVSISWSWRILQGFVHIKYVNVGVTQGQTMMMMWLSHYLALGRRQGSRIANRASVQQNVSGQIQGKIKEQKEQEKERITIGLYKNKMPDSQRSQWSLIC